MKQKMPAPGNERRWMHKQGTKRDRLLPLQTLLRNLLKVVKYVDVRIDGREEFIVYLNLF